MTSEVSGDLSVIDSGIGEVIATVPGKRSREIHASPDQKTLPLRGSPIAGNGSRAHMNAANDGTFVLVDAVKFDTLKTIPLGKPGVIKPMVALPSHDATRAVRYVSAGRGQQVLRVDRATPTVRGPVTMGKRPWGIALSPDAKTLYSVNGPSNNTSVVNLADHTAAATIPAGTRPWGVIVLPR